MDTVKVYAKKLLCLNDEWASLKMEMKDGKETITFSIESPSAWYSAETWKPGNNQWKRRKTPSDHRRDERRKAEFIAKKTLESQESTVKDKPSHPVKVVLVEPKDEINLDSQKRILRKKSIMLVNTFMTQNYRMMKFTKLFGKHCRITSKRGLKNF